MREFFFGRQTRLDCCMAQPSDAKSNVVKQQRATSLKIHTAPALAISCLLRAIAYSLPPFCKPSSREPENFVVAIVNIKPRPCVSRCSPRVRTVRGSPMIIQPRMDCFHARWEDPDSHRDRNTAERNWRVIFCH